jgi:hypothetical protein
VSAREADQTRGEEHLSHATVAATSAWKKVQKQDARLISIDF